MRQRSSPAKGRLGGVLHKHISLPPLTPPVPGGELFKLMLLHFGLGPDGGNLVAERCGFFKIQVAGR